MAQQLLTFTSGPLSLEGVLDLPSQGAPPFPAVVLCHPHPLYGGDMWNNVVMAMASGLTANGIAALRFNFRGVGASEGSHDGGRGEAEDALAALAAARSRPEVDRRRVSLAGYSFGAGVALAAGPSDAELRALAVVAPPARALSNPAFRSDTRAKLVVAGDVDSFMPLPEIRALVAMMAQPVALEVLGGADHFMQGFEEEIATLVGRFFAGAHRP